MDIVIFAAVIGAVSILLIYSFIIFKHWNGIWRILGVSPLLIFLYFIAKVGYQLISNSASNLWPIILVVILMYCVIGLATIIGFRAAYVYFKPRRPQDGHRKA